MKLGPVTKLDKKSKTTSKKSMMTSCHQILTSLPFSQFKDNLEQSETRITDAWSVKFIFSLTVTFYFTKAENRPKLSLT